MLEFQGWTPVTIDNLTFDQLELIIGELNDRRKHSKSDKKTNLANIPSAKGSRTEISAWYKAGCPSTFKSFVGKLRKQKK